MRIRTNACAVTVTALLAALPAMAAAQTAPSFDCAQKLISSVERRICQDPKLAELDRQFAETYAAAMAKVAGPDAQALTSGQRGWIKGRNDCWKSGNVPACIESSYYSRIAELQARYRLVNPVGAARYKCPGPPPQDASAEFFATEPPSAIVEFAGASQFMFVARSGSGARYTGGNRQFWEHQEVAAITWGVGAQEQQCPRQ